MYRVMVLKYVLARLALLSFTEKKVIKEAGKDCIKPRR